MTQDLSSSNWNERYVDGRTGWDRGEPNPQLMEWLEKGIIEEGASIVIPGCGRGHEVIELAKNGFIVTAVDFAKLPLTILEKELKKHSVQANLIQQDVLTASWSEEFDYIYEQTCLCALDPSLRTQYEQQLRKWLKPGGSILALFMQSNREDRLPYHCSIEDMKILFSKQNWTWPKPPFQKVDHPANIFERAAVLVKR